MKKTHLKTVLAANLFTLLLGMAPEAHAGALDSLKNFFKSSTESYQSFLKEQAKKEVQRNVTRDAQEKERQKRSSHAFPNTAVEINLKPVSGSLVNLKGATPSEVRWLMFQVQKISGSDKKEIITTQPMSEGQYYDAVVALPKGAGKYKILVFGKSAHDQYDPSINFNYLATYFVQNNDSRDMSFLLPTTMVQSEHPEVKELSERITAGASSEKERLTLIFNYITSTVKYNNEGYKDGSYLNDPYDALTVLRKPVAVCAGYSNFFAALLRAAGIRVKVINGPVVLRPGVTEEHAWNEVFIDGKWESIDSTWSVDRKDDRYFLADPVVFSQTHTKTKELDY